ncbi:MAG: SpoIIE family protein phosphatase [Pseudonocardia sp.]
MSTHHPRPSADISRTTSDPAAFAGFIEELNVCVIAYQGPDHVVLGANRAARAFFIDRPDIIGRPLREVFPEIAGQHILEVQERVRATGVPFTATEWRVLIENPDGPGEVFINFDLTPVRAPDGTVTGLAGWFYDVTESVQARRALEADAERLRERYQSAQGTVLALQRSLLPGHLPVLPGFRVAARYLVAAAEQAAGGDWFEAIPVDGRLYTVVGDVVGHGAAAAAVMGQLRALLVEFLLDGDDLLMALRRLDRFASRTPGARGATVCLALLDPADGSVRYTCAGHPPPLVVRPDGSSRYLPAPGGVPLGVAGPDPEVGTAYLRPGELLLCYSDGLIERHGVSRPDSMAELARVAADARVRGIPSLASVDLPARVAELTVERITRDGYVDDVTVLVVELTGRRAESFRAELPATTGQLAPLRTGLSGWLDDLGASQEDVNAVLLATLEAATNSIEHAYPDGGGRVLVEGAVDGAGRACLTVSDNGSWRTAPIDPGMRGRGLLMIRECMDSVEIEVTGDGTSVLMDRQLRRRPVLSPAHSEPRRRTAAAPAELTIELARSAHPRLIVAGPVDVREAPRLRSRLWTASRGGALPLTIDLDAVTHLASAGIALLFEFVEDMATDGREVTLVAPPGCPARYALEVSGLDLVAVTDG